jgi:hypothetical protein
MSHKEHTRRALNKCELEVSKGLFGLSPERRILEGRLACSFLPVFSRHVRCFQAHARSLLKHRKGRGAAPRKYWQPRLYRDITESTAYPAECE